MRDAFMAEIDLPAGIVLSESHFCLGTLGMRETSVRFFPRNTRQVQK